MQGGEKVSRWSHNPQITGSSPVPAIVAMATTPNKKKKGDSYVYC